MAKKRKRSKAREASGGNDSEESGGASQDATTLRDARSKGRKRAKTHASASPASSKSSHKKGSNDGSVSSDSGDNAESVGSGMETPKSGHDHDESDDGSDGDVAPMQVDATKAEIAAAKSHNEATKASKRAEQKELRRKRQAQKPHAELVHKAKLLWEKIRPRRGANALDQARRSEFVTELIGLLKGKVLQFALKHDGARVVQWAFKLGSAQEREDMFDELSGHFVPILQSHFGRHVSKTIMKYMPRTFRDAVITELYGNVARLVRHRGACQAVNEIFCDYCSSLQQSLMVEELFSSEFRVFKADHQRSLADILEANPEKRPVIMPYLAHNLEAALNKGTIPYTITHVALLAYMRNASDRERASMAAIVAEHVVEILHTKPGAAAAILCISYGTAKTRKVIAKSFKGLVARAAVEEYGHLVVIRLLQIVDDTVLIRKTIVKELIQNLYDIVVDAYGARIILFLLLGAQTSFLGPWQMAQLPLRPAEAETEGAAAAEQAQGEGEGGNNGSDAGEGSAPAAAPAVAFSKKDPETIREQNRAALEEQLMALIQEFAGDLLVHKMAAMVVTSAAQTLSAYKTDVLAAIADACAAQRMPKQQAAAGKGKKKKGGKKKDEGKDEAAQADAEDVLLTHRVASRAIQRLIKASTAQHNFAGMLWQRLVSQGDEELLSWATGTGSSFVILALLECDLAHDDVAQWAAQNKTVLKKASKKNVGSRLILKNIK